jgi:hypothetical protein
MKQVLVPLHEYLATLQLLAELAGVMDALLICNQSAALSPYQVSALGTNLERIGVRLSNMTNLLTDEPGAR